MTLSTLDSSISIRTDVPWDEYVQLRDEDDGHRPRMTYHNGDLIVFSPEYLHERGSECLSVIVQEIVHAFEIEYVAIRTTTMRCKGRSHRRGSGKEPDLGYYFSENEAKIRDKQAINLEVDPPPDLALEVENKADAERTLPILATLGVPELWRYDVRSHSLRICRLVDGAYHEVDRSGCLPMLSAQWVSNALDGFKVGMNLRRWEIWVRDRAARLAATAKEVGQSC